MRNILFPPPHRYKFSSAHPIQLCIVSVVFRWIFDGCGMKNKEATNQTFSDRVLSKMSGYKKKKGFLSDILASTCQKNIITKSTVDVGVELNIYLMYLFPLQWEHCLAGYESWGGQGGQGEGNRTENVTWLDSIGFKDWRDEKRWREVERIRKEAEERCFHSFLVPSVFYPKCSRHKNTNTTSPQVKNAT